MLGILRILCLGNELGDLVNAHIFNMSIAEMNRGPFAWAFLNLRHHGGDRNDAHRQQRPAEKVVQQRAFAGLEAPKNSDVQEVLFREGPTAFEEILERDYLTAVTDFADAIERSVHDILRPDFTHST